MIKRHEIDMTTGSIPKKVLQFAIPLMLTNVLQFLFHSADTVIVGRFSSSAAMAAVGSTGSLISLLLNLFIGTAVGTNVLCARYFGAKDHKNLSACVHASVLLGAFFGIAVGVLGFTLSVPMLELMKLDITILPLASLYLKIYFLGAPANLIYNFSAAVLRGLGDTQRPLRILIVSGIVNIVLNMIFVIGLGMSADGVALATIISQYLSMVLVLRCLRHTEGPQKLHWNKLRPDPAQLGSILRIGLPAGLNNILFSFANVTIQSSVNSLGPIVTAGSSAASGVADIVYMGMTAFSLAASPFTSQNLGAKQYDRIPKVLYTCLWMSFGSATLLGIASCIFSTPLLSLFIPPDDPTKDAIIAMGHLKLLWMALPYGLCGLMQTANGMLQGLGKNWMPFGITIFGSCILRIAWVKTVFAADPGMAQLFACYPVSWVITTAILLSVLIPILRKLQRASRISA